MVSMDSRGQLRAGTSLVAANAYNVGLEGRRRPCQAKRRQCSARNSVSQSRSGAGYDEVGKSPTNRRGRSDRPCFGLECGLPCWSIEDNRAVAENM